MKIEKLFRITETNSVFEIPIYRLTNTDFEKELDNYVRNSIPYSRQDMINMNGEKGKIIYDEVWMNIKARSEYNWKFNEIIGWILICLNQGTVFGEIFLKKTKRIRKNSSAKIAFRNCGFKVRFDYKNTNKQIFASILNEIQKLQESKEYKNRYIDKSKLETIGSFINWKKLYSALNG